MLCTTKPGSTGAAANLSTATFASLRSAGPPRFRSASTKDIGGVASPQTVTRAEEVVGTGRDREIAPAMSPPAFVLRKLDVDEGDDHLVVALLDSHGANLLQQLKTCRA